MEAAVVVEAGLGEWAAQVVAEVQVCWLLTVRSRLLAVEAAAEVVEICPLPHHPSLACKVAMAAAP